VLPLFITPSREDNISVVPKVRQSARERGNPVALTELSMRTCTLSPSGLPLLLLPALLFPPDSVRLL
jgi:hypothetical protein